MTYAPRPYQLAACEAARVHWAADASGRGAMLVMATGTGKTETALALVVAELEAGRRVVWLAHRQELLTQPVERLARYWPEIAARPGIVGIVQGDRDEPAARFVCASVQTLAQPARLEAVLERGIPSLVVVDEAHHSPTPTHRAAIEALRGPDTRLLGLTATPDRDDGADLSEQWEIVYSYAIVDAIRDGYLVPPYAAIDRLAKLDLSRVRVSTTGRRDYDEVELGRELLLQGIVEHTVAAMAQTHLAVRLPERDDSRYLSCDGRPTLVYTVSVEQAQLTAEALRAAGRAARWVSGETPRADRRSLLAAFTAGHLDCLCSAAVLTEGVDLPATSAVVLARPTRSWPLYSQIIGRGLRLHGDSRDCLVLDLVGATAEHSLISAPVLIGGTRCPKSPNGVHDYGPVVRGGVALPGSEDPRGQCRHCGGTVPCLAALVASGSGAHSWHDALDGTRCCSYCLRPQCPESRDGRHTWIPIEGVKRQCVDCALEVPDQHAGIVGTSGRAQTAEADWMRVPGLAPETWCVDVGEHGILYVVGSRSTATWTPIWLPRGARKPRPLVAAPIDRALVRAYADDLVRRAARLSRAPGRPTEAQHRYGERLGVDVGRCRTVGDAQRAITLERARQRAIATGIAREG